MKQETNNEIDLLLRRLSRRQSASAPDGELRIDTDHLDADELSSYAENALPAAARARYTQHLAECSTCRELVVQLTSSVGVVAAAEISTASEPSGLKKFLASLFSPMVLRYAVPALGLIVVAVIGFAVFRKGQNRADFVATSTPPPTFAIEQSPAPLSGTVDEKKEKSDSAVVTPEARANRAKQAPSPETSAKSVDTTTDARTVAELPRNQPQPLANEAPAQPASKPTPRTDEFHKLEAEGRKQEEQARTSPASAVDKRSKDEVSQRAEDRAAAPSASAPAKTKAPESRARRGVGAISGLQRDGVDKDQEDTETRSVAGRRFRKQRGIWVDTAYDDDATVNLSRGSEQYRALVADEPAIKTIAEQLDGQIIVVWKGRAYKIR